MVFAQSAENSQISIDLDSCEFSESLNINNRQSEIVYKMKESELISDAHINSKINSKTLNASSINSIHEQIDLIDKQTSNNLPKESLFLSTTTPSNIEIMTPPSTFLISEPATLINASNSLKNIPSISSRSSTASTTSTKSSNSVPPFPSEHNKFNKYTNNLKIPDKQLINDDPSLIDMNSGNYMYTSTTHVLSPSLDSHNDIAAPISAAVSSSSSYNLLYNDDNNEVFDNHSDDVEASNKIQHERRRSSKRAMSSSIEDYSKVKTRMGFLGARCTPCESENEKKFYETKVTTLGKKISLNLNQFENKNPFDYQNSMFSSHKFVPSLKHCRLLSIDETIFYLLNSFNKDLPDVAKMFPWLHGIHKANYGQISFLSNSLNSAGSTKPRIITFEKPASLDENNYLTEEYSDDDDEETSDESQIRQSSIDDDEIEEELDSITKLIQTPNSRFLMPIRSCNNNGEVSPNFTNIITESVGFIKGSVSPEDLLISYSSIVNLEVYLHRTLPSRVFKFYHPETIITDCIITGLIPVFKNLDPESGINLRNFHIQVSKISNISDFIVYCFNEEDHLFNINHTGDEFINTKCKCLNISRLLHIAQLVYQGQHPEILKKIQKTELLNNKKFNTFILSNLDLIKLEESKLISIPLLDDDSSSKNHNELCSTYDINVFNNWDSNYLYRERLEISKMSTATPISTNIWLGNITDYECLQIRLNNKKNIETLNKESIDLIIENQKIQPLYCNPNNTTVKLTKKDFKGKGNHEDLDKLLITFPMTIWKFYIKCVEGARVPSLKQLKLIYDNYKDCEFINIEFPPSGSMSMADMSDEEILSIINICKFCYYICKDEFPCLIYCSDGYTESSLLSLCYLMYSLNISLDEALLKLHNEFGRPFFIFKTDYILLTKLETIMNKFSPLIKNEDCENFKFEDDTKLIRSLLLLMPKRKNSVGQVGFSTINSYTNSNSNSNSFVTSTGRHVVNLRGNSKCSNIISGGNNKQNILFSGNAVKTNPIFGINNSHNNNNNNNNMNYLYKPKPKIEGCFEEVHGSLPSRILNHLYLGSLTHANSIPLLNRLGIDYIVSVGEKISWYDNFKFSKEIDDRNNIEILKYESGQIDKLSGYNLNVKKLLILNNINDDGIGTLISAIDKTLEFINECYLNKKRVLVHCQVGVSRSATVCIAEVMKRLKLSLPRAYLYVRVRRLNVIIQPNLKLMYELFKWEENYLKKKKKNDDEDINNNNDNDNDNDNSNNKNKNKNKKFQLIRNDSISSSYSASTSIFTNQNIKSSRSSISTTRGNSWSNNNNIVKNYDIDQMDVDIITESREETAEDDEAEMEEEIEGNYDNDNVYDVISNLNECVHEVNWSVLCREIYNLNRAYIK